MEIARAIRHIATATFAEYDQAGSNSAMCKSLPSSVTAYSVSSASCLQSAAHAYIDTVDVQDPLGVGHKAEIDEVS